MMNTAPNRRNSAAAIIFAMVFPSVVTWVYFQWLQDSKSSLQQLAFGLGKLIQFGFPIVFVLLFHREKVFKRYRETTTVSQNRSSTLIYAIAFGLVVAIALVAIYATVIPIEVATHLKMVVTEKITSLGIDSVWKYAGLAVFYAICHSFLEEYYWRWFVFDLLRSIVDNWIANIVSSIGFMTHHVIVLAVFFGWTSPLTYLFSICVATGGSFWAWLYSRENSLRTPWISHAIVDAAIFAFGFYLVQENFV